MAGGPSPFSLALGTIRSPRSAAGGGPCDINAAQVLNVAAIERWLSSIQFGLGVKRTRTVARISLRIAGHDVWDASFIKTVQRALERFRVLGLSYRAVAECKLLLFAATQSLGLA
jgi:hypothetical protein